MTRRWALVSTIAVPAVALAFVVVHIVRGPEHGGSAKQRADVAKSPPVPRAGPSAASPKNVGWWPLHGSGTAKAGEHDAVVAGGSRWVHGPAGGALWLDGNSGCARTGTTLEPD